MFRAIQCDKCGAFRQGLDNHFLAFHHVCVKAVQGLTICHHNVVGDVHNVVDRTYADDLQIILQPFGTFFYFTACHGYGAISRTAHFVLNLNADFHVMVVNLERICIRAMQAGLIAVLGEPCVQIACDSIV